MMLSTLNDAHFDTCNRVHVVVLFLRAEGNLKGPIITLFPLTNVNSITDADIKKKKNVF